MRVAVGQQAGGAPFATKTAILPATEKRLGRGFLVTVDEDRAGFETAADALGVSDVLTPHAGTETGFCVVGSGNDFFLIRPRLCRNNWTWLLLVSYIFNAVVIGLQVSPKGSSWMIRESFGGLSIMVGWMKKPLLAETSGSPKANL